MRRLWRLGIATALVVSVPAGVALADQTIYAGPPNQFIGGDITINQGEKVSFTDLDTVEHNVTAEQKGADAKPLFASASTSTGSSQPVAGTEYLTTGTYQYFCSIHPWMTGTITVTSSGTPAQRPSSPPSSSPSSQPKPGKTSPPKRHKHKRHRQPRRRHHKGARK